MQNIRLMSLAILLCFISACVSPHDSAKINLISLTQEYLDSESEEERKALLSRIEDSFLSLNQLGDDHFKVPDLPAYVKTDLMKDIDWMGFGAKEPKWEIAYSCNGFHYIIGFTCLVKRKKFSSGKEKSEEWIYDSARNYFLFDGVPLKEYPLQKLD